MNIFVDEMNVKIPGICLKRIREGGIGETRMATHGQYGS